MKSILTVSICLITAFLSIGTFAAEEQQTKPRRFIFLVHGLNGNDKTFGALSSLLLDHGGKIQPQYEIIIKPIKYATGEDSHSTYDFARKLGEQMQDTIGNLRPTDRITLVAHSQGGLISWIWYLNSYAGAPYLKTFQSMALQTEGLMTLGSPMWGSKLATFAHENEAIRSLLQNVGLNLGREEVKEMTYSSDTIFRFRKRASDLDQSDFQLPLRVSAVAGILPMHSAPYVSPGYSWLLRKFEKHIANGWGEISESDIAVAVPSARFDFIYLKKGKKGDTHITTDDFRHFKEKNLGQFAIVQAPHMSFNQNSFFDMAEVPEECRDIQKPCTHPTYALILEFTMACTKDITGCRQDWFNYHVKNLKNTRDWTEKRQRAEYSPENMHTFILDVVLDLPAKFKFPKDKNEILKYLVFPKAHDGRIQNVLDDRYHFVLNRDNEFYSTVIKNAEFRLEPPHSPIEKQMRVTFHGSVYSHHNNPLIFNQQARDGFKLPVKIEIPGTVSRQVDILIKPTYSTFLHLDLREGEK